MSIEHCNDECDYGKNCVSLFSFTMIQKLMNFVWGPPNTDAPMPSDRLKRYTKLFKGYDAALSFRDAKRISFKINKSRICEASFLIMIGLISPNQTASQAPSQWARLKRAFIQSKVNNIDGELIIETIDEILDGQSEKLPVRFKGKQGIPSQNANICEVLLLHLTTEIYFYIWSKKSKVMP